MQDHLRHLKEHKSMEPGEMNPRVLRELANELVKPLLITCEKQWQSGKVPLNGKGKMELPLLKREKYICIHT